MSNDTYHSLAVGIRGSELNSSFQFGSKLNTTFRLPSDSYSALKRYYCYYVNPYPSQVFRAGDRVIFGPSTYSGYEGVRESGIISAIGTYYFELDAALSNIFNTSDEISGTGSNLAAGWYLGGLNGAPPSASNVFIPNGIVYPKNISYTNVIEKWLFGGVADRYRQYVRWNNGEGYGATANDPWFKRNFGNVLLGGTTYRFGVFVKGIGIGIDLAANVNDGSSNFINAYSVVAGNVHYWLETTTTGTTATNPTDCSITFYQATNPSGTINAALLDDLYIEHAKYTDGDSAGVYTFTEIPIFDSEQVQFVPETEFVSQRMPSGRGFQYQESGTGDKMRKFIISMNFEHVDKSFFNNLNILLDHQRDGNHLIFHPSTALAAQTKPVIHCLISITGIAYKHWERSRSSFQLIIEEI